MSKKKKSKKLARRDDQRRTLAAVAGAVGVAALAFLGRRQIGALGEAAGERLGLGGRDRVAADTV